MTKLDLKERLDNLILRLEKDYKELYWHDIHEDIITCSNDDVVKIYTALNNMECALCASGEATEFEVKAVEAMEIMYMHLTFLYD